MDKRNNDMTLPSELRSAVTVIKQAILQSQYRAAKTVNREQLSLYFGIGRYISEHSREGYWGTGAIESISEQLQRELPGLRGFSAASLKKMRIFYEQWQFIVNRSPMANDLECEMKRQEIDVNALVAVNRSPMANDLAYDEFLSISFTHHYEILAKTENIDERIFYIHQTYLNKWDKYKLRNLLKADLYHHQGQLPNNFAKTIPATRSAIKAIEMFKDEYLLDLLFYNRELAALVVVELKRGDFKPAYLGQLSAYLRILDSEIKKPFENPSVGIILCKQADKSFVEFLIQGYDNPMGVATYKTAEHVRKVLPTEDELRRVMDENV